MAPDKMERAIAGIEKELDERVKYFKSEDKLIEATRISERTHLMLRCYGRPVFVPALRIIPCI